MKTLTILLILIASAVCVNAEIITHSHCPNHHRNNTENMHTHDTTDADHNAKHVSGHPHTWEFDEFCPKGTERDTSKKSRRFDTTPPSPCVDCDTPAAVVPESPADFTDGSVGKDTTDDDKAHPVRRGCYASDEVLAELRKAFSVVSFDYPVIELRHEETPLYFENNPLAKPFRLDIVVYGDKHQMAQTGRCGAGVFYERADREPYYKHVVFWADDEPLKEIDLTGNTMDLWRVKNGYNAVKTHGHGHCDLDNIGNWKSVKVRAGNCALWTLYPNAPSAPSLRKPKLTTMWARLKAKQ